MKKLLLTSTLIFMLGFATQALAVGTWELTQSGSHNGTGRQWRQYTFTADDSDGSVPAHTVVGFHDFYIYSVEIWPGGTAPTDGTDLTLIDATTSSDLLGGKGTNAIDATASRIILPMPGSLAKGNLTLNVSNNSVNSAVVHIRITGVKAAGPGFNLADDPKNVVQTSATVTSTASTIVPANDAHGKNVMVINNDLSGTVYLNLSGTATADRSQITLDPEGGSYNFGRILNAISAIGDITSNVNVVILTW